MQKRGVPILPSNALLKWPVLGYLKKLGIHFPGTAEMQGPIHIDVGMPRESVGT